MSCLSQGRHRLYAIKSGGAATILKLFIQLMDPQVQAVTQAATKTKWIMNLLQFVIQAWAKFAP